MPSFNWQFPQSPNRKNFGFNNQGIAHFTGDRFRNVIREVVQNSLDAVDNEAQPVGISIRQEAMPVGVFAGESLREIVDLCIQTSKVPTDKPILEKMAQDLERAIETGTMPALAIGETNTTGASDILTEGKEISMWEALTNSEGVDVKAQPDSGGKHGIGKNAPYNVSSPRTVLYSTKFKTGENGAMKSLFIGRSMLVSHQDEKGNHYTYEGYLGAPDFYPLRDEAIAPDFRRDTPGLTLYIIGFNPPEEPEDTDWQTLSAEAAVSNFFHSIVNRKVVFDIDDGSVNADNIRSVAHGLTGIESETRNFVAASSQPPVASTYIDGIGTVNLYLDISEDPEDNRREVALVRDSGMLITDKLPSMNLPGLRRESSLPRNLKGFTAIVECLSAKNPSLVRDAESPSHDQISADNIQDEQRRSYAKRRFAQLAQWLKGEIQNRAKREVESRKDNADELNQYMALVGEAAAGQNGFAGAQIFISKPREIESGASPTGPRRGRRANVIQPADDATGNLEDTGEIPEGDSGKKRKSRRRRKRTAVRLPNAFAGLRFVDADNNATHVVTAIFDTPQSELRGIKLVSVGEDSSEDVVGLKNFAEINGKRVSVKNDTIRAITPSEGRDRTEVRFHTQEPVAKSGQALKSFDLKYVEAKV